MFIGIDFSKVYFCSKLIIDTKDRSQAKQIEAMDIKVFDTKLKMQNKNSEEALASFILKQVKA